MTDTVTPAANVKKPRKPFPVKRVVKWVITLLVLAAAAVIALRWLSSNRKPAQAAGGVNYQTAQVERRTITSALSGSGTLQPANSYTVTTLAQGDILSDTFEEGDLVEEGQVLYVIDSSDASTNIEKAQISLDQANRSYQKAVNSQRVTSDVSGQVWSLEVEVGDKIGNGQTIAQVRDSTTLLLKVPFPADDAAAFYVGQAAQVTMDSTFETLSGAVKGIAATDTVSASGQILRTVTVAVNNPGGLAVGQTASAAINGVGCAAGGSFTYASEGVITATAAGTVTQLDIKEGDAVTAGQTVLTLGGEDLTTSIQNAQDSLRNAQLSMENTREQLENYTVTAPVTGTVVDKSKQAGETVSGSGADQTLCTIYDLSYLEMTIDIDELDISKVAVGQEVTVTADAVEGKSYTGVVTKVSVVGTTSMGITSYPATVRIDQTDGLLPGMNVDAEIVLSQAENTLAIPSAALSRGNRVLVTADSPSAKNAPQQDENRPMTAPDGYVYVEVQTGQSDDNYVEILSGLTEGDTVAYLAASGTANTVPMMGMNPNMGGGMPNMGGGMPNMGSGGAPNMGGGNRSGNFSRGGQ